MSNTILPSSNSRRSRGNNENKPVINNYQEVYTDMSSSGRSLSNNDNKNYVLKQFLTNDKIIDSVADNMGTVLNIASEIVRIKGSRVETENKLLIMDKEIEKLQKATDDYVKMESAKRITLKSKTDATLEILNTLTQSVKGNENSDDIKALLINTFTNSINKVWEDAK